MFPKPDADTCVMLLLRHGATENNLANPPRLQGNSVNLGLSAKGRKQAEMTAAFLQSLPLADAYASTLLRAIETAQIVGVPHGLTVRGLEPLVEVNVGAWEERDWGEIARSEPEDYQRFINDPGTYGYRGGENLLQVQQRVAPTLERIMAENLNRYVLVVGHNVVNRAYLAKLMGLSLAKARGLTQNNCGINVVRYRADETKLVTMNAVFHLVE